jgi:hypothetical protein
MKERLDSAHISEAFPGSLLDLDRSCGIPNITQGTSGATVKQQLLPLIPTVCRGHSGVNKSPLRAS